MSSVLQSIVKGGFKLSLAKILVIIIQIISGFFLAKILGPQKYGEVGLFNLILLYGGLTGLGFFQIALREIPMHIAKNDLPSYERIKNVAFTVEITLRVIVCILLAIGGFVFFEGYLQVGIIIISVLLFVERIFTFYQQYGNATKAFGILSKANVIYGFFAGISVLLVNWLGIYTKLIGGIIAGVAVLLFFTKTMPLNIKVDYGRGVFVRNLQMGLPFVLLELTWVLWTASDRTIVANMLTTTDLGIYTFASTTIGMVAIFYHNFNAVLQPYFFERTGIATAPKDNYEIVRKPAVFYAFVMPLGIIFVWILYPYFVLYLMPEYNETIWPFRILLAQLYLRNILFSFNLLLMSSEVNKQWILVISSILSCLCSYVGIIFLIEHGYGLIGASIGLIGGSFVGALINIAAAHKYFIESSQNAVRLYATILIPIAYTAVCLFIFDHVFEHMTIMDLVSKVVMGFLASIPLLYYLNKELDLLFHIRSLVTSLCRSRA